MAADVVEPADCSLSITHHDKALGFRAVALMRRQARDFLDEVIPRLGYLTLVSDQNPLLQKNSSLLLGKNFRRNKVPLRQSLRAGCKIVRSLMERQRGGVLHSIRVNESNASTRTLNLTLFGFVTS